MGRVPWILVAGRMLIFLAYVSVVNLNLKGNRFHRGVIMTLLWLRRPWLFVCHYVVKITSKRCFPKQLALGMCSWAYLCNGLVCMCNHVIIPLGHCILFLLQLLE
ncbi:hypothetical protein K501DRAFT_279404 [Backusella circina FSU 941]|nr:hypothetical protein K501DRAFT_280796 [Backusella circina FSU 941]KAI8876451.1 hypothetical protein K501DRAFT_279404 [Backusella circina FSU 941]